MYVSMIKGFPALCYLGGSNVNTSAKTNMYTRLYRLHRCAFTLELNPEFKPYSLNPEPDCTNVFLQDSRLCRILQFRQLEDHPPVNAYIWIDACKKICPYYYEYMYLPFMYVRMQKVHMCVFEYICIYACTYVYIHTCAPYVSLQTHIHPHIHASIHT